ncbi:putative Rho GTPase activation protein [Plasmopara halstedii]
MIGSWILQRRRSQSELPRLYELERAVQAEIKDICGREELFLRSTSELTSLMKKLGQKHGRAYFRYVLRNVFGEKSMLYEVCGPPSTKQVCAYAKSVIQRMAKAIHFAPLVLRACCYYMLTEFRKAFPDCKQDARIVVGSLLFLRIICPALIKPEMFDFPAHTSQSLPVAVQIAKILQHTLSGTPVGDSNSGCDDSNAFINTYQPFVASFLVRFPQLRVVSGCDEPSQMSEWCELAAWDGRNVSSSGTSNWRASQFWNVQRPTGKFRGLSLSVSDVIKNKKKFSLRFWSRGSTGDVNVSQRPTPSNS